jgi:hypothetical protein
LLLSRVLVCFRSSSWILAALLLTTGCYTRFQHVSGRPFPEPVALDVSAGSVGITQNAQSSAPPGASVNPAIVVERFANRVLMEGVFEPVIYPYTSLAHAKPAVVLDTTVRLDEKLYVNENGGKAMLHGLSFFLLRPALPHRVGFVVDLAVTAFAREEMKFIGSYGYASEYELEYTHLTPTEQTLESWIDQTIDHAVEEVLNQLKRDLSGFPTAMAPI